MAELPKLVELSIRFTAERGDASLAVSLFRPDAGTATPLASFEPPLDDPELTDLRWYLEVFTSWPTGPDYERAGRIEARLEDWGRALLKSVIGGDGASRLWQQFVDYKIDDKADGKLLTVDATDPRVLRLPWELLADEGGHLFARGVGVRRRLQKTTAAPTRSFDLPVRVLVVVSRPGDPDDAGFIDPRAVSLPLLDALDELGDRVEVEFLYPPTFRALTDRLRDSEASSVHVVHFDGHGVYDAALGLGYLLFEDDVHREDRVDANRLGILLNRCGIPLMVLNACQSAKQEEENPYASVAARLIRAGVGSVLTMTYPVLVVAARKFVAAFYAGLADGLSVGKAVDEARYALVADEERHALTRRDAKGELVEETIHLRDWFLPALYQQAADPVVFGRGTGAEGQVSGGAKKRLPLALTDPNAPGGLPAEPLHGFQGRAREMLRLERALAGHAVVVLHGFGGVGKTALAAEAGRWFHRTGRFPGGAAFVSFEHGGSLSQLCSWVGQAVSGDPNFQVGEGDPAARVGTLLRNRPALVILDNFESVLGQEPFMPSEELKAVLDAVWSWVVGAVREPPLRSRVLITTRDVTFNDARFGPSKTCAHVALEGLAQDDALGLAAAVLDDNGIDREDIDRQDLVDLMDRLGGHPLSLYLALPYLRDYTPADLSARFESLLPGFKTGAAKEKNESLTVSLEFSLRRLGDDTRAALPALSVFQGGAFEDDLLAITGIDPELWRTARAEMERAALVTAESLPGVTYPFLRFHPTLIPYLASQLPPERRTELEERYWKRYYAVADYLYQSDTQHPHQARAIAVRELPNLCRALDLAIAAGELAAAVDFADSIARFLNAFGRWREQDALMKKVAGLQVASGEGLTKSEYLMLSQRGEALRQQGREAKAEKVFRDLLARMEAGAAYDAAYDHAVTLLRIGRCLAAQGQSAQAIAWHRRALGELERISKSNEQAKSLSGYVHAGLADSLTEIGQFNEAQNHYETSLEIAKQRDDHRSVGVALGQLGSLALRRGDLAKARRQITEALDIFRVLGEPEHEAIYWHQLGMVAEAARDWDKAERCYRESLKLDESYNDLPGMARTYNQLAMVAEGASRIDDAERWYLRTIKYAEYLPDQGANVYSNLANLYLSQGRLDEAARYARRAVEIKETLDLSAQPWTTYSILARITEARGQMDEAAQWRRKEQESFAAYAGSAHEIRQYQSLIAAVVRAAQGDSEAQAFVEGVYPKMEAGGEDWRRAADVIRRVIAGERDGEVLTEGMSRTPALVIRTILARLAGELPDPPATQSPAPEEEGAAQSAEAQDPIAHVRQQWGPVVQAVVAACEGNAEAAAQLAPLLEQLSQQEDWRNLVAALRRILTGECDAESLLSGLDATDTLIATDVLRALGVEVSAPAGEGSEGMTLDDLLALVASACRPDAPAGLAERLHAATRDMAAHADMPAEIRALGRALNEILSGERDPDLSALPSELADKVRELLEGMKQ